jgi:multidrug efflux pump subunit AcrB
MLNEVMTIDGATMSGLFPDLPLKNREEWADALIKKDLYELAYRKFVLKDPNASDYYATSTSQPVIKRYGFEGDAATSKELRDLDKQQRFDTFKNTGEFKSSKYNGKHYTSTIEKILKKQAKENNSEVITMPVQLKKGSKSQYQVTDQNGNMVATLTNEDQARELMRTNPNYQIKPISIPDKKSMEPVFAIKITEEMLESFATHKAKGGLVSNIDIFEVA